MILDTGVLIAFERGLAQSKDVLGDDADIAIAAITASELLTGVELADELHRSARQAIVGAVLESVDVLPFDLRTAQHHATLVAETRRSGRPRGAHDLQIAATARATGRVVVTTDRAAFDDLSGVEYRLAAHT